MRGRRTGVWSLAVLMALAMAGPVQAASPEVTAIHVANMHCADCAKKIASKLYGVPGVVLVKTNYKADMAWVSPQQFRKPSPKAMWEAVEKAGFKPIKMEGPAGTFTQKPAA